jgi:hypothetical protein
MRLGSWFACGAFPFSDQHILSTTRLPFSDGGEPLAASKYAFWRPITAIRNGDIDGNAATEREATWQPIDNTPMHPEYPCAHCIVSSAVASAIEAMLGTGPARRHPA